MPLQSVKDHKGIDREWEQFILEFKDMEKRVLLVGYGKRAFENFSKREKRFCASET